MHIYIDVLYSIKQIITTSKELGACAARLQSSGIIGRSSTMRPSISASRWCRIVHFGSPTRLGATPRRPLKKALKSSDIQKNA